MNVNPIGEWEIHPYSVSSDTTISEGVVMSMTLKREPGKSPAYGKSFKDFPVSLG